MFNVIIPTFKRPAMLRTALKSIAEQTRGDLISRVVVSENGGDRASEGVCNEFPSLPIEYILRSPQISSLEHAKIQVTEYLGDEFTVILHDDDWWSPQTIENAARGLVRYPEAVCYASAYFNIAEESAMPIHGGSPLFWFGAGYPAVADFWELSPTAATLAALINTPAIFSAMFVQTRSLKEAADVFWLENGYDVDRMLTARLANLGTTIFHPLPDVMRRLHPGQDCRTYSNEDENRHMTRTTDWILSTTNLDHSQLLAEFNDRLARCPDHAREKLAEYLFCPWCIPHLKKALGPVELDNRWQNPRTQRARRLTRSLKKWLPFFGNQS